MLWLLLALEEEKGQPCGTQCHTRIFMGDDQMENIVVLVSSTSLVTWSMLMRVYLQPHNWQVVALRVYIGIERLLHLNDFLKAF